MGYLTEKLVLFCGGGLTTTDEFWWCSCGIPHVHVMITVFAVFQRLRHWPFEMFSQWVPLVLLLLRVTIVLGLVAASPF